MRTSTLCRESVTCYEKHTSTVAVTQLFAGGIKSSWIWRTWVNILYNFYSFACHNLQEADSL